MMNRRWSVATLVAVLLLCATQIDARRRVDLSANLTCHWESDELSGNLLSDVNNSTCELTDTNTVGTGTIDSTGARDYEASNSEYFDRASNSTLALGGNDQAYSMCVRVYPEVSNTTMVFLVKKSNTIGEYGLLYEASVGWSQLTVDEGAGTAKATDSATMTASTLYVVCGGHNASANQSWVRVNSNSRVTASAYVDGTRDGTGTLNAGANHDSGGHYDYMDGLMGPISFWKRSISDTDMDDWATCKGAYSCITGGGGGATPCRRSLLGVGCEDVPAMVRSWYDGLHMPMTLALARR